MTVEMIIEKAKQIKEKYKTDDPFALAKELGAQVVFGNFGENRKAIKGFYTVYKNVKGIMINANLSAQGRRIICYHEIGHLVCTRDEPVSLFHDYNAFENSTAENDANLFAAEIMIEDKDVLSRLNEDYTLYTMAMELCVPVELLIMKFKVLNHKGYDIKIPTDTPKSNFLKNLDMNYYESVWW